MESKEVFKQWAEEMNYHKYQLFMETTKIVELVKKKKIFAKTKNEMIIVVKRLQETLKSVNKALSKYIE